MELLLNADNIPALLAAGLIVFVLWAVAMWLIRRSDRNISAYYISSEAPNNNLFSSFLPDNARPNLNLPDTNIGVEDTLPMGGALDMLETSLTQAMTLMALVIWAAFQAKGYLIEALDFK